MVLPKSQPLRKLSFYTDELQHFEIKQIPISLFVNRYVYPVLLYCPPVIFAGLLKIDFETFFMVCQLIVVYLRYH